MRNLQGHSPGWSSPLSPGSSAAPEFRKLDIHVLLERATAFQTELELAKNRISPAHFEWYPYYSWTSLVHLDILLTDRSEERRVGKECRL